MISHSDIAISEPKLLLYRVQDRDGRGPFKPGFSHRWVDEDARPEQRPSVFEDFGINIMDRVLFGEYAGCGCRSLEALLSWFSAEEMKRLEAFGYRVVEIEAHRIIAESKTQVLFGRNKPLKSGVRSIDWKLSIAS